jgi:hypothetical protein
VAKIPNSSRYTTGGSGAKRSAVPILAPQMNHQGADSGPYAANPHQAQNPTAGSGSFGWILIGLIGLGILVTHPLLALSVIALGIFVIWLGNAK